MSVALGLRTESSARHEKGLPPALTSWGAARTAHLLERLAGGAVHAPAAFGAPLTPPSPIALSIERVPQLLGMDVGATEAEQALRALGFDVRAKDSRLVVTPPPWRSDVRIAEDVVEEIARIVGYERITAAMPPVFAARVPSTAYGVERRVAHALVALGYFEIVTLALQSAAVAERYRLAGVALENIVEIANPLSEEQRYLRFSLMPGLLAHAATYAREGLRSFEVGRVFEGTEPRETPEVAWLAMLPARAEPAWRDDGFRVFKGESLALVRALCGRDAETADGSMPGSHPGKTATLRVDGIDVATIGAVDPRLLDAFGVGAGVYVGRLRLNDVPAYRMPRYVAPSKYPPVARDLAVVVAPEVPSLAIEDAVRAGADGVLTNVHVFDEYRGPQVDAGKKSLAVRIVLQHRDRTLTDAEADAYVATILASLRERCGATLRE